MKSIKEQKQELNNNKNGLTVYPRITNLLFDCVVLIMLMKTYKTKLNLNNKQRTQLLKNAGVARFAYNLTIQIQEENYKNSDKFLSDCDIRKQITILKQNELNWLYDYSCDIVKQSVKDACLAYKRFFKKLADKPKFKSKKRTKPSFFIDGWKLKIENGYIKFPHCTKIKLYEKDYIPEGLNYANPRITFDGIDWWISVGVKKEQIKPKLTNEIIGIDLGLKELATCSNGMVFHNVVKFDNYKKLEKSIKQKQRQVARKYEKNKQDNKFVKTSNIIKLEKRILKKRIKQNNIKKDYFHKSTTALVRTKPSAIVLEDLNVAGMRKNKHLSHAIQSASISMFKDMLINKAQKLGIEIVLADRFYPSSQICSSCGNRKVDLKLSERTYKCPVCELEIDRDFNASINLKHYREFPEKSSLWRTKQPKVA
jgi:putative transposase